MCNKEVKIMAQIDHTNTVSKRQKKNKKSHLVTRMLVCTIIPIMIALALVGFILLLQMQTLIHDLKKADLNSQGEAAAKQIELYFSNYSATAELLADTDCIVDAFKQAQRSGKSFSFQKSADLRNIKSALDAAVKSSSSDLQTIFIAGVGNSQYMTNDGTCSGSDFNILERPWYQMVANAPGETIITEAYVDDVTGGLIVTVATGSYDGSNLIGIIGMDISLDALAGELAGITIGETGYLTVYDCEDMVLYHPDSSLQMTHISNIGYSDNMLQALQSHASNSADVYTRSGIKYCGSTTYSSKIGWQILACMPYAEFNHEVEISTDIVNTGFGLVGLLLAAIMILVSIAITTPIRTLNTAVGKLAAGDLDVEINAKSNNEIGELAESVAHLVDRLKGYIAYINEISGVLSEIGNGDLDFELTQEYVGEFAALKTALNSIQVNLNRTMYNIVDSAAQVNSSTGQIASAAQALAQGATEQASAVEELSATVIDLSKQSQDDSQRATELSRDVAVMGTQLEGSNRQMQNLRTAMDEISAKSSEIAKIIKTIEDIAFQTNILALNAAVEAARAGAAGKGFAVVADEVRSLAGKSADAAQSITALISTSLDAIDHGSGLANETAASLDEVAKNVAEVVAAVEDFAVRYQEQTVTLDNVSTGIEQISAVVQNNSATAEESAATSEELSSQAHIMKELTGKFVLDPRFRN